MELTKVPIIYSPVYNIRFWGLQKLHPFDSTKYERAVTEMETLGFLKREQLHEPDEVTDEVLLQIHTERYLESLHSRTTVARITEVCPVVLLPMFLVRQKVLRPLRAQVGGSLLGVDLAMQHQWAINLGGGFHHASGDDGGGFCVYADISLCIRRAYEVHGCKAPLIVDLDCHQGNGYERDVLQERFSGISVGILDAYNREIYPCDRYAKNAITFPIEFRCGCSDDEYISELKKGMDIAMKWEPDFIIYNAGTDILEGDPLGRCDVSPDGVVERDAIVFRNAQEANVPILMLLSGGYQKGNAAIIARSILNLRDSLSLF